jgi:Holliday junction DNA helicase RuvA
MYAYIRGKLEAKAADHVVVEAAGVGYRIYTSANTLAALPSLSLPGMPPPAAEAGRETKARDKASGRSNGGARGAPGAAANAAGANAAAMAASGRGGGAETAAAAGAPATEGAESGRVVKLHTRLVVKEDSQTLYGFLTQEELGIFDILLTVSKVGPKIALGLLSAVTPSQFGLAVVSEDYGALTRAQGVGKKLAQTIVFELRDKLGKSQAALLQGAGLGAVPGGAQLGGDAAERGKFSEAVSALMILGYKSADAQRMIAAAYSDSAELEDIIRNALASAGRRQ